MSPDASLSLLEQDDTIPGNRKDGFRYRYLLFIIVVTPLYLWLELSFGVRLLDGISSRITAGETDAIEHWGRLISGCAVSLLFLSGWLEQCEKLDLAWPVRILVGVAITFACITVTWWGEGQVIDFYVRRSTVDVTLELSLLLALVIAGFLALRAWLRYSVRDGECATRRVVIGMVIILVAGYVLIHGVSAMLSKHTERLGLERQRAATLTLVRKGVQQGYYGLVGVERDERALRSPEGKAFLALFPVFGRVFDQERFARDRAYLLAETMYRDWDDRSGGQAYAVYRAAADRARASASAAESAAAQADLGNELGCFDCVLTLDMDREAFGREFFKWTQANNVRQAVEFFGSARNFESGRDGERAARTYWVPIWALLFSMLGAFTNFFKLVVTLTEYAHRLTFNRIRAADSPLANQVISNSRIVTAAVVIAMGLFIYFADNRITAHERYVEMRPRMWHDSPIVGGIAAHWTVNAQGLIYPFTRKIRPSWLTFDEDPLAKLPFLEKWIANDDE